MNSIHVSVTSENGQTTAIFDGELTIYSMESLSALLPQVAEQEGLLIVDLRAVSELDGSGFQFLQILKRYRSKLSYQTRILANDALLEKLQGLGLAAEFDNEKEAAYGT
jgi:anti-anti-sigma regulatory factor